MKRQFSAGGVVYKREGEKVLWLVRMPSVNPEYKGKIGWTLPKGWIEPGEKPEQAAVREVAEEGGVVARILEKLATLKLFFMDATDGERVLKFVTYYLMEYVEDTGKPLDVDTEKTAWAEFGEAWGMLMHKSEKKLLEQALTKMGGGNE